MSLTNVTIKTGGTISVAGGSDVVYTSRRITQNMIESQVVTDPFKTRRYFRAISNSAKPLASAPNGLSLVRNKIVFFLPITLANGNLQWNQGSLELAFDVEASDANKQELLDGMSQCAFNSTFTALLKNSALT